MEPIPFDNEKLDQFFKGKYTEQDESYIDSVFCDNDNEKELKKLLSEQFDKLLPEDESEKKNLDHILYRIHYDINSRLSEPKSSTIANIVRWSMRIAGIIMLPILILMGIHLNNDNLRTKDVWVEIKAPAWTRARFSLPDGTTGWLNSNSSVKYSGNFISERHVTLSGEAFFDVYKDKKRPFTVTTDEVVLKVLGTRFNIASYANEKNVEVVLEEGSLEFNDKEMKQFYSMVPNDLVIYDKTLKEFTTEIVQPQKYLAWTEGRLVFRNDPLDVICRRLERWYNIDVEVNVNLVENFRLRATFIDENLEEVLKLLKRSLPIDYKIQNGNLNNDNTYDKMKVIILPKTK
jgi:ferric-dicitrate binding protein FerR (iron transport regulator)